MQAKRMVVVLAALALVGCGKAEGTLQVTAYGEEFIEQGIPKDVFKDGWSVKFSRFLVSVGAVVAKDAGGQVGLEDAKYRVVQLAKDSGGKGFALTQGVAAVAKYGDVAFRVAPATAGLERVNATEADGELMAKNGYSVYVEGVATKGTVTKSFAWGFKTTAGYTKCESTADVAKEGATGTSQLTFHADHLFYDDLFSEEPNVAFDLIAAADANADGKVEEAELKAMDITTQARYQVGSTGIKNLWDFVSHLTGTLGHIDGEGHCHSALE